MQDAQYILDTFRDLILDINKRIIKSTEGLNLSEKNYKKNLSKIARIEVSVLFNDLTDILRKIDRLKETVALENGFEIDKTEHHKSIRQFCDEFQDLVNIASSLKTHIDKRSGLRGFFKGYTHPVETILSGTSHQLSYQQLRNKFSYQATILNQSERRLIDSIAKELDHFMATNF